MMKKSIISIGILILIGLIAGGVYLFFYNLSPSRQNLSWTPSARPPCLKSNEVAAFQFIGSQPRAASASIIVNNKITGREVYRFQIDGLVPNHGHSYELYDCGVYIIRQFNYDVKTRRATPNYRIELWKYDYGGFGKKILLFSETDGKGTYVSYFNDIFSIDPREVYVALEQRRTYSGEPNEALTIRDVNTQTDSFVLRRATVSEQYPQFTGSFQLRTWTKNGNYFWADLSVGAVREAFLRILRDVWGFSVLPAPKNTLGGTAFNPEYGYITYDTGPGWIGIDVVADQVYDEWRREGKVVELYLYNLFTKEKIFLATSSEPSWNGNPNWLSDTELEYTLPSGEKRIYTIF